MLKQKDAVSFQIPIIDDSFPGAPKVVDIPGSLYEGQNCITREDAVRMNLLPAQTLTAESQVEAECARICGMQPAVFYYEEAAPISPPPEMVPSATTSEKLIPVNQVPPLRDMPKIPLGPPKIYTPEQVERSLGSTEASQHNDLRFDADLFEKLHQTLPIRNCGGMLYIFRPECGCYVPISDAELKVEIDRLAGRLIRKCGRLDKSYSSLVNLFHYDSSIVVSEECQEFAGHLWPFLNCIVNIDSGDIFPNDGRYFNRYCLQCKYDLRDTCHQFSHFIQAISVFDKSVEQLLWEVIGYILSPDANSAKAFFVFVGEKNSGKSLLANTLCQILGPNGVSGLSLNDMGERFALSSLAGKYLNVCMDLPDLPISRSSVAKLKQLTGGDLIRADIKNQPAVQFYNTAKLLFGSNYRIRTESRDAAFQERCVSIPFRFSVPKEKQDPMLLEKFKQEYSGIVNMAIPYYLALRERNFQFTDISLEGDNIAEDIFLLSDNDILQDAINECFLLTKDPHDTVTSEEAYTAYTSYCARHAISPLSHARFSVELKTYAEKKKVKINGQSLNCFTGIRLSRP